ncbi:MAG: hypothetical protein QXN59_00415 [Candidatus Micrarchaeaceae archaeon]
MDYNRPASFKVEAVPNGGFDPIAVMMAIGSSAFCITHDFSKRVSLLTLYSADSDRKVSIIKKLIPGLLLSHAAGEPQKPNFESKRVVSVYASPKPIGFFYDIFSYLDSSYIEIFFVPVGIEEINSKKLRIGRLLSKSEEKGTTSISSPMLGHSVSKSFHTANYNYREELDLLRITIESLESSLVNGWPAYKVYLCFNVSDLYTYEYVKSRFAVLDEFVLEPAETSNLINLLDKRDGLPFGIAYSKNFFTLPYASISYVTKSAPPAIYDGIEIGEYMRDGVVRSGIKVNIDPTAFNLGCIVTGMPGTGKTSAVMGILDKVHAFANTKIVIISPTKEWRIFAENKKFRLVDAGQSSLNINFFRCPNGCSIEKFYENLAMVISHASAAGPYQKPLEKCLLDAFERFKSDSNPDPLEVYNSIEDSVIKLHGKRTNTGIKYTKHGENINSAIEDLRLILRKPQFRSKSDTDFTDIIKSGAVFDISSAGPLGSPYLYALILNQLYSIVDSMDEMGENKLRMLICLEESQLIFGDRSKENDAALRDIKNRIQDFRKKGVGIMLIAHNISEINQSIRNMCQIKAYFKQAPSEAEKAAADLVFSLSEKENLVTSLMHLERRIFALNYVSKSGGVIKTPDSIFVRSLDQPLLPQNLAAKSASNQGNVSQDKIMVDIEIEPDFSDRQKAEKALGGIKTVYLVDFGIEIPCEQKGAMSFAAEAYKMQHYVLSLRNSKNVEVYSAHIIAAEKLCVRLSEKGISITY